ncbi:PREDICTED: uncharacterized protein LOC104770848 [Camelina sativa]|uniref:Uncharacterized protein LOC104770848 n=1 Tax=Camelina sativa TaxID=90675 RepID=A0ABM1RFQ5_CAMSA|nr:PREDICTED: uncharacterized protein LOC104770848 [Camelina sativa]
MKLLLIFSQLQLLYWGALIRSKAVYGIPQLKTESASSAKTSMMLRTRLKEEKGKKKEKMMKLKNQREKNLITNNSKLFRLLMLIRSKLVLLHLFLVVFLGQITQTKQETFHWH